MEDKIKFILNGEHWCIKELGDLYGDRQEFNERLEKLWDMEFNQESEYLEITIKRIPK